MLAAMGQESVLRNSKRGVFLTEVAPSEEKVYIPDESESYVRITLCEQLPSLNDAE
jgi:hypothetical protein